jgi:MFS family permease
MAGSPPSLAARFAFPLIGPVVFAVALGVNLQVPLYVAYAKLGGYGASAIASVFAIYAGTLVVMLFSLGGLSDRVGRKPTMVGAVVSAGLATGLVELMPSLEALAGARFLQGVAIGLATSAGTAYAAELAGTANAPQRAARIMTATVSAGFGLGAALTALIVFIQPSLSPASYMAHLALLAVAGLVTLALPETRGRSGGSWLRKPLFPKGTVIAASAIIPAWTVTGILIAVVPSVMTREAGDFSWTSLALCLINTVGVAFQPLAGRWDPARSVRLGLCLLVAGMALIALGGLEKSVPALLIGAAVAGSAAYGLIFTGGLTAVSVAAGSERARASAGFFLFAYIGFSVPPLITGFAFDRFGAAPTLIGATALIAAVSAALFIALKPKR